jgi:hypothetical protein
MASGMNRVRIGYANRQVIASVEFYPRPLSNLEIAAALDKSKTYPIDPKCPF